MSNAAPTHAAGLASRTLPEPAGSSLEKETPSPESDASPKVVELLDIPHEILERLLWLLVAEPAANPQQAAATYLHLARASSTCRALLQCAESAWRELTMAMLGGQPWLDPPPPRWSACVQNCAQPLTELHLLTHGDGHAATSRRQRLGLPRRCFAHSTVQWRDALYLWGGRDDATYSNQLHVLPLRMALDTTCGDCGGGGLVRARVPYRDDRRRHERGGGGDTTGGGGSDTTGGGGGCGGSCWETPQPSGTPPAPRRAHTATVAGHMMHVLGGGTVLEGETYGDHHALDLRNLHWSSQPAPPDWHAFGHTCVLAPAPLGTAVMAAKAAEEEAAVARATEALAQAAEAAEAVTAEAVWGTPSMIVAAAAEAAVAATAAAAAAVAASDITADEWTEGTGAEATGDSLLVFGGAWNPASRGGMGVTGRLLAYHLGACRWREVCTVGVAPEARYRHAACLVGGPGAQSMAVWGGYVLDLQVPEGGEASGVGCLCSCEPPAMLCLASLSWSRPRCSGVPPSPRGGHAMCAVGSSLCIFGGGDLRCDHEGRLQERDLAEMTVLDTARWRYLPPHAACLPAKPRGGATLSLLPCEGGLCLLLLGGRDFVPPPPNVSWPAGKHLGRDDAHLIRIGEHGPVPGPPPIPKLRAAAPSSAALGVPAGLRDVRSPP